MRMMRSWSAWTTWLSALVVAAGLMLVVRARLDKAHVAMIFLLVVLGGSAAGGRALGISLALLAFLAFNFLFLPPYLTLDIHDPLDWLVLLAFLATGIVAAQLLYRAQAGAEAARQRTAEVDRLASLGAETLSAGRAEEALTAIARVIRTTIGVAECEVWLRDPATEALVMACREPEEVGEPGGHPDERTGIVAWVAAHGRVAIERGGGVVHMSTGPAVQAGDRDGDVRALVIPLAVRERTVGVLRLADDAGIQLDDRSRRFLEALAYYAALGVERVRLSAVAGRAESLREADRLKDALLAGVSHDIRTPLTTIRALAHRMAVDGDARALVIEQEVGRLDRFVTDLLDLSRLAAGGVTLTTALNTAEDLIGAALQRVSGMTDGRRVGATLDRSEPMLVGRFDFAHSLRILVNLLENALKYSPAAEPVELAARREGDALLFTVSDRGPGVAPGEVERIFERFYRPPGSRPDVRSAGLGLAIARGLAEAQGGTLRYAARDGGGSVFELRLPAADVADADIAEAAPAPDGAA